MQTATPVQPCEASTGRARKTAGQTTAFRPTSLWAWSLSIAVLVTTTSLLGLFTTGIYDEETLNWATQAQGQDVGNLLAVVTLLVSCHRYAGGSHRAGLVWMGTLFYLVYAFLVYAMAVHFNSLFLVYVAALGLSSYALFFTVDSLRAVDRTYHSRAATRSAGCTSIAIGVVFALLWLSELAPATIAGKAPRSVVEAGLWVNPIHVIDLALLLPGFVIAGWLTLRHRPVGQFLVSPLLVFSVLMGASIVAAMVLMTIRGFEDTLAPLVMVSGIVLVSLFAACTYLDGLAPAN